MEKKTKEIEENSPEPTDNSDGSKILKIIENGGVFLFHDELGTGYARVPIGKKYKTMRIDSKDFKMWLSRIFYDRIKKPLRHDLRSTIMETLEAKACNEGSVVLLHNRVTWHENALWYDLGDGSSVCVTQEGWQILNETPVLFRSYNHQKLQVHPIINGHAADLFKLINVTNKDKQLLLLVWLVSCFLPDFPHPILYVHGPQGSAKSTLCKTIKELVDPSQLDVTSFPNNENELVQMLSHNWFLCFDNVKYIPKGAPDTLCRAVTGASFAKRSLYTNDDDFICRFKRCIVINGINLGIREPDLMERSILLELDRISENGQRKEERELNIQFEGLKSSILGGIFDCLVKAIQLKITFKLTQPLPRMADFATWGCVISEALGYKHENFLKAYKDNQEIQNDEVLNESTLAVVIRNFMSDKTNWSGTPTQMLGELKELAAGFDGMKIDINHDRSWPKNASNLTKRLNELKTNLENIGIKLWSDKENKKRIIRIEKVNDEIIGGDTRDAGDDDLSGSEAIQF